MKIFKREPKSSFEELKDVFIALGKGFSLREAMKNGFQLEDLDEIIAFVSAMPEAIVGAKSIKFAELTDEQKAELRQIVVDEWEVPDNERVDAAIPFIVDGILNFAQGVDLLA